MKLSTFVRKLQEKLEADPHLGDLPLTAENPDDDDQSFVLGFSLEQMVATEKGLFESFDTAQYDPENGDIRLVDLSFTFGDAASALDQAE